MEKNRFKLDEGGLIEQGIQDSNKIDRIKRIEGTMAETEAVFGAVKEVYDKAVVTANNNTEQKKALIPLAEGVIKQAETLSSHVAYSQISKTLDAAILDYKYIPGYFKVDLVWERMANIKRYSEWLTKALNSIYTELGEELEKLTTQNEGAGI